MEDFETLYGELFDLFYDSTWGDDELAAFKMQVGDDYENGPLFVGRAPNGWTSFCPSEWNRNDFIQDPMLPDGDTNFSDWLANNGNSHYSLSRSNFWKDAKRIFYGLYEGDFATDIAYSNLCKIARFDENPTNKQCYLQLNVCREILLAEIAELEPECIVFMTGYHGWAEWFFDDWDDVTVDNVSPDEAIKCSGEISGCPFVVIHHPGYKSTEERNDAVTAVIDYFQDDDDCNDDDCYDDDCNDDDCNDDDCNDDDCHDDDCDDDDCYDDDCYDDDCNDDDCNDDDCNDDDCNDDDCYDDDCNDDDCYDDDCNDDDCNDDDCYDDDCNDDDCNDDDCNDDDCDDDDCDDDDCDDDDCDDDDCDDDDCDDDDCDDDDYRRYQSFSVGERVWYMGVSIDTGRFLPVQRYTIERIRESCGQIWLYVKEKSFPIDSRLCAYSKKDAIRIAKNLYN